MRPCQSKRIMRERHGLLERLETGVVIGDGGFTFELEKRGYVRAGKWTPEVVVECPEAVRQLHREFLRAGSDVMQTLTFSLKGNAEGVGVSGVSINHAACELARGVADEGGALMAGCICQTMEDREEATKRFRSQVSLFVDEKVDLLICEFFELIEEMEWAISVCKETDIPLCATMCVGPLGNHGSTAGECAVRMAQAGADVVGVNCRFGPNEALATMTEMKSALDKAGLRPYLMAQPLGFHVPDGDEFGFVSLPEHPLALEPRSVTRWDMATWARQMYDFGVRYIGGCCGVESYHVRAMAEELAAEHGRVPKGCDKHNLEASGLKDHNKPLLRARAGRAYWDSLKPSTGRPESAAFSTPQKH